MLCVMCVTDTLLIPRFILPYLNCCVHHANSLDAASLLHFPYLAKGYIR